MTWPDVTGALLVLEGGMEGEAMVMQGETRPPRLRRALPQRRVGRAWTLATGARIGIFPRVGTTESAEP